MPVSIVANQQHQGEQGRTTNECVAIQPMAEDLTESGPFIEITCLRGFTLGIL
jgi:hypothetical protein